MVLFCTLVDEKEFEGHHPFYIYTRDFLEGLILMSIEQFAIYKIYFNKKNFQVLP